MAARLISAITKNRFRHITSHENPFAKNEIRNKEMRERRVRYWRKKSEKRRQILELASRKTMNGYY